VEGEAVAYVCSGYQCGAPIVSLDELVKVIF